jgi:hypothetical protein
MSSFCAPIGLAAGLVEPMDRTIPLGAAGPLSSRRYFAPEAKTVASPLSGLIGSWLSSSAYGSNKSLFGLKRLPAASTSLTKPAAEPLVQAGSNGQFGPQAR